MLIKAKNLKEKHDSNTYHAVTKAYTFFFNRPTDIIAPEDIEFFLAKKGRFEVWKKPEAEEPAKLITTVEEFQEHLEQEKAAKEKEAAKEEKEEPEDPEAEEEEPEEPAEEAEKPAEGEEEKEAPEEPAKKLPSVKEIKALAKELKVKEFLKHMKKEFKIKARSEKKAIEKFVKMHGGA